MSDRLKKLEDLVRTLRGPGGCPWDREQRLGDLRAYVLEEAHELAAAIDDGAVDGIREELGDLLFQIVFVAELVGSSDAAELDRVIDAIHRKMVDRHPHVFGEDSLPDADTVRKAWESRKARFGRSALAGVPDTLPGLLAAYRISQKAAGVGFDWPDAGAVLDKIEEELEEVRRELADGTEPRRLEQEVGDLLFATANLARKLGFDPEASLHSANRKFRRRFAAVEASALEAGGIEGLGAEELDELWRRAKAAERETAGD